MTRSVIKITDSLNALDDACERCRHDHVATPKIARTMISMKYEDPGTLPSLREFWRSLLLQSGNRRWGIAHALLKEIALRFNEAD